MAELVAAKAAKTAILDEAPKVISQVISAVNAIRSAAWAREELPLELADIESIALLIEKKIAVAGLPTTPEGQEALSRLDSALQSTYSDLEDLRKELPASPSGLSSAPPQQGGSWSHKLRKLLLCCSGSSKTVLAAAKDAAFPPKQRHQLEGLKGRLKDAFNTAEKHGAFTYAQQLPWGLPRLYIRHPGLWQEVTDKLHKVAADPSLQGVLITGARGMGKSTLARDVALSFQQDPSSPFPDGVFEAYFGPGQEQGDAGLPAMVASQQQLLLNRMKGIEGGSLQNISQTVGQQLGNWLRGKRCLLVLDDVRSDQIISAFNYDGFQGALLVTGLSADVAWLSAPLQVAITPKRVKDPLDGDSGPSLAMRVLASRASNDKSVVGVPEACQDTAEQLLEACGGSVVSLVVLGSSVWANQQQSRGDLADTASGSIDQRVLKANWSDVAESMQDWLADRTPEDYHTGRTVFDALELALNSLQGRRKTSLTAAAFLALEPFRAGTLIPLPLVQLAVQEYTGTQYPSDQLERALAHAVSIGLLEHHSCKGRACYKLLDVVALFLDQYEGWDPNSYRPSSLLFAEGAAISTSQQLLAAFLTSYGKQGVLQSVQHCLGLGYDAAGPELSMNVLAAGRLAERVSQGLQPQLVVARVLAYRAAAKFSAGDFVAAVEDLDRADQLEPDDAFTLQSRGAVELMLGKYAEALKDLERAGQLEPDNAFTLRMRGAVKGNLGKYAEALKYLERAGQLEPDNAFTLQTRGAVKRMLGQFDEALKDLERADQLEPDNAFTLRMRGAVKGNLGKYAEALKDLERAGQLEPDNAFTLQTRGAVKRMLGQFDEALKDLERADQLEPDNAFTLQSRGIVKNNLGDYDDAVKDLERAGQLEPDNAFTLQTRGAVKRMLGQFDEALKDLERADQLEPDNAFTLRMRGAVELMLGKYEEAVQHLDQADKLQPNKAFTLRYRGAVKRRLGKYDKALEDLERADQLEPNNAFTQEELEIVEQLICHSPGIVSPP